MRLVPLLLIALTTSSCGRSSSSIASAPDLSSMTEDEACQATAARGTTCANELLVAEMRELNRYIDDPEMEDAANKVSSRAATSAEARRLHQLQCEGEPSYPKAVVSCWNVTPCTAFAQCLIKQRKPIGP